MRAGGALQRARQCQPRGLASLMLSALPTVLDAVLRMQARGWMVYTAYSGAQAAATCGCVVWLSVQAVLQFKWDTFAGKMVGSSNIQKALPVVFADWFAVALAAAAAGFHSITLSPIPGKTEHLAPFLRASFAECTP